MGARVPFLGVKLPGSEGVLSSPSSGEDKYEWSYALTTPHVFIEC
jgi:hypothetical protein